MATTIRVSLVAAFIGVTVLLTVKGTVSGQVTTRQATTDLPTTRLPNMKSAEGDHLLGPLSLAVDDNARDYQPSGRRPGNRLFKRSFASLVGRLPRKTFKVLPFGSKITRNDAAANLRDHSRVMLLINEVVVTALAAAPAIPAAATTAKTPTTITTTTTTVASTTTTTTTAETTTLSTTGRVSSLSWTGPADAQLQDSLDQLRHTIHRLQALMGLEKARSTPKYAPFGSKLTKQTHESVQTKPHFSRFAPRGYRVAGRHRHSQG